MSERLNPNPPRSERELEEFFLQVRNKLKGTTATLEEVDQRSGWPGSSISSEFEREIRSIFSSTVASLRAHVSELETKVARLNEAKAAQSATISDLERRIDSIEKSARY